MKLIDSIKRIFRVLKGFFPTALPTGMDSFDNWFREFVDTYALPCSENDAKFVLTTTITRLGPTVAWKSNIYFYMLIRAAAAKQIAGAKFQEMKAAQAAQQKKDEATAHHEAVSFGSETH